MKTLVINDEYKYGPFHYTAPFLEWFYILMFVSCFILFYKKTRTLSYSFIVSALLMLIGTEYWELPILVSGIFGLFGRAYDVRPEYLMNHVLMVWTIILLYLITRVKFSLKETTVLIIVPVVTAPLLLLYPPFLHHLPIKLFSIGTLISMFYLKVKPVEKIN